jgi:uncharacterized protein
MSIHLSSLQGIHLNRRSLLAWSVALLNVRSVAAADFPEMTWDDLMPKGWNPMGSLKEPILADIGALADSDPRAQRLQERLREVWDNAPVVQELAGRRARLPGFIVPLEETKQGLREFLLVPYFGACIHTPPPPANQIVHVRSTKPLKGLRTMDAVWVRGTLAIQRADTQMGVSGYAMDAESVVRVPRPA